MVFRVVLVCVIGFATNAGAEIPAEVPESGYAENLPLTEADFEGASSFAREDRIVGTYYFYWYDVETNSHMTSPSGKDGLMDHPTSMQDFSYRSVTWHRKQLEDMMEAGIDFAVSVYWGCPACECEKWSFEGLPPLVEACDSIVESGGTPPKIAMFYDTHTLHGNDYKEKIDLTTDFGREWFYATVRDFFAMIPPKYWAMIDGKPIVFLYLSKYAKAYDQTCFDYLEERFKEDFAGRSPYVVRETSWKVDTDNLYAWGAAVSGFKPLGVTAIGPGYDHSPTVPPRQPHIVDREGGQFYENNWRVALSLPSNIVAIETWNELHEGTDICETKEYGRQYIDLTAKYSKLFHEEKRLPPPSGPYSDAQSVSVVFGKDCEEHGVERIDNADGMVAVTEMDGVSCVKTIPYGPAKMGYVYLRIDDSFTFLEKTDIEAEIEFLDNSKADLWIEYDGADIEQPKQGAYTPSDRVQMNGTGTWRTEKVSLPNAWFLGRQNAKADLRISHTAHEMFIRRVMVTK